MLIDKEMVQAAKEKLGYDNADIIAEFLGVDSYDETNKKGLCPFHHEKTPSFIYNPKKYNMHCFGCGKTVDIIDALTLTGMDYVSACKKLFDMANMKFSLGEYGVKTEHSYRYPKEVECKDKERVYEYLGKRGISKETVDYCDVRQDEHGNIVFNYYDLNSVLTMVKYRPSHKVEHGKPKMWFQKDTDNANLLWRMNMINPDQPLLICEGCIDCMAAIESGYTNAVSVSNGAGSFKWIEACWNFLEQFDSIIIASDNDEAGQKMKKECVYRLGTWRTKIMEIPEFFVTDSGKKIKIKDINEMMYWYGKEAVLSSIINAKDTPVPSVEPFEDIEEISMYDIDGIETGIKELDRELIRLFNGTLTILSGRPGCVDCDTEYFNGKEWKRIDEYETGEKVLQYDINRKATLVDPMAYIKEKCQFFYEIKSSNGVEQCVSSEHSMVFLSDYGEVKKCNVGEFIKKTESGEEVLVPATFNVDKKPGISLSNNKIRLMCYCTLYGVDEKSDFEGALNIRHLVLKGALLYNKVLKLLKKEGVKHFVYKNGTNYSVYFHSPLRTHSFDYEWYNCSREQIFLIIDTIRGKLNAPIRSKEAADFIQYAYSIAGVRASISSVSKNSYQISLSKDVPPRYASICKCDRKIRKRKSKDGYKYCFSVPSGMLVLRRNGKINVTGNSGKSSLLNQIIANTIDDGKSCFLYSQEMNNRMLSNWFNLNVAGVRHVKKRSTADGKEYYTVSQDVRNQIKAWTRGKLYIYKDDQSNKISDVLVSLEDCARKYGVQLFIIDNMMMLDLDCDDVNRNSAQTKLINDLISFSKKYNVVTILVAHPKKTMDMSSDINMYEISGNSTIINLAMRSIGLRRVGKREKEDPRNEFSNYDVVLTVMKDRMLGKADLQVGIHYDFASRRFYTNYEEFAKQYSWDTGSYSDKIPIPDCLQPQEEVFGKMEE